MNRKSRGSYDYVGHADREGTPGIDEGEEDQKEPQIFQEDVGADMVHAFPVEFSHIEEQNYYYCCEEVDEAEGFGGPCEDVQDEHDQDGEVESLELFVLFGQLHRDGVIFIHLGCLHVLDVLVELDVAALLQLLFLLPGGRVLGFVPLAFLVLVTGFITLLALDGVDPVFDEVDDGDDSEDGEGEEGEEDGTSLAVLGDGVSHSNFDSDCKNKYRLNVHLNYPISTNVD